MFQLPTNLITHIFEYDNTYHSIYQLNVHKIKYNIVLNELHNAIMILDEEDELEVYKQLLLNIEGDFFSLDELKSMFFNGGRLFRFFV
jgi:hypothetical protein